MDAPIGNGRLMLPSYAAKCANKINPKKTNPADRDFLMPSAGTARSNKSGDRSKL